MGKVIHWEMFKKYKFDYTNKWYMQNPAYVLENEKYNILRNFLIQTNHLISTKRQELILINMKKEHV